MNFGGKISYKDPNRTFKHLFFNLTLSVSDILRPLAISTEEFEQKWTEASFEKKQKLSTSMRNCQEFSKRAEDGLKLYPVEIIGGWQEDSYSLVQCISKSVNQFSHFLSVEN